MGVEAQNKNNEPGQGPSVASIGLCLLYETEVYKVITKYFF